jgi:hypothetical protein
MRSEHADHNQQNRHDDQEIYDRESLYSLPHQNLRACLPGDRIASSMPISATLSGYELRPNPVIKHGFHAGDRASAKVRIEHGVGVTDSVIAVLVLCD